jgi:two-component system, NarL family, nitrate/nitrite response regulator NarL
MVTSGVNDKVRVVVADDHPMYREGVVRALKASGSVTVVGQAGDGVTALSLIREHEPEVALLDYRMPGLDGAQIAAQVRQAGLRTRILLVSADHNSALVYQALQDGAAGFLPKESTRLEILNALIACAAGQDVVAPSLVAGLAAEIQRRAVPAGPALSERENQVLQRISRGQSIPVMAAELHLAPSTVKSHVQRLYEKLGANDRATAVAEAMRRKLIE